MKLPLAFVCPCDCFKQINKKVHFCCISCNIQTQGDKEHRFQDDANVIVEYHIQVPLEIQTPLH